MARTAIFVSEHGGQSEIVLRVKQGDNPTFGFLMPDNQLHPYFRFLVGHPQLLKSDSMQDEKKSDDQGNEALVATGGALSLLGSVYGTGDDDDNAPQEKSNEEETRKLNAEDSSVFPHKSVKEESASLLEDKEPIKRTLAALTKEKSLIPKKNHFVNYGFVNKKGEGTTTQHDIVDRPGSQPGKSDAKSPILEPPSFLKRTIDKIVEFIIRNGKEFETVLIEQDKTAGRFPFLLSSNQYHSYYLKVLQEPLESKLLSKNSSDGNRRRAQEAVGNGSTADEEFEGCSLDLQRKEKFKMVIGSKKEANDPPLKPVRQSGATADEAAAIVLAATRGRSPASAFQNTSVSDSDTGRASSIGSLSLHKPEKTIYNPRGSNGEAGNVAVATADVTVATIVAKTVALATAGEADSSEASLTKEQKLKAERLKRAKMFAAMLKSGVQPTTQLVNSGGTPNEYVVPSTASSNHEREGSSVPFDAEVSGRERNYRKKQHSRSKDNEEDSDEDHKHSRKKHRSDDHENCKDKESRHHDDHKHRKNKKSRHHHSRSHHKHHNINSEDEHRHEKSHRHHHWRHKHHSDSENEERQEKSSRHLCCHRKHELSDDEDRNKSRKHRRKHRSPSEKRDEIEEGEVCERSFSQSEETGAATVLGAKASDVTEVPSDLRAKIRAMLLETM